MEARGDERKATSPATAPAREIANDGKMSIATLAKEDPDIAEAGTDGYVAQRLLLKFKNGAQPVDTARTLSHAVGARTVSEIPQLGVKVIELPEKAEPIAQLKAFRASPHVEYAELDRVYAPADITPNDFWYFGQWHLTKIAAPAAWATTTGSSNVIIAICDTGVESTHPDLAGKLVPGWNVFSSNSDTHDVTGHGTSVAGTAGAAANNSVGVASVAWGCPIMPIRVSDGSGMASSTTIANGMLWAADHGARVVNVSYYGVNGDATITSAAQYLQSKGGVVTTAGGNDGLFYSAPDNPYLLAVSATGSNDVLASFSSRGNYIDLAAPGAGIFTTSVGGAYASGTGTSFAAPIVAGVAALVISAKPSLTAQQVQDILKQNADDLGTPGWDSSYGWGRVNAARSVAAAIASAPPADTTPPTVGISTPGNGATVWGTTTVQINASDNVGVVSVSLYVDGGLLATATSSPYSFAWNTGGVLNGYHTLQATARDAAGNLSTTQASTLVSNLVLDVIPPTVIITFPQSSWTALRMMTSVPVTVAASDNVGVTRVELYVGGVIAATTTSSPYSLTWSLTNVASGLHLLRCKAYDAAGNVGTSPLVGVYR